MKVYRIKLAVQFLCFLALTYGGLSYIHLGNQLPTFSCAYVPDKGGACFLASFQHMLSRPLSDYWGPVGIRILQTLGFVALWAVALNKAWCGWVCPFGFLQDMLTEIRTRLRIDLSRFSWLVRRRHKSVKYIFLALLILIPMGIGNALLGRDWTAPFCQMCPARVIMPVFNGDLSQIHVNFSGYTQLVLTSVAIILTGLFFTVAFVNRRFFCSYCPMLAFLSLFDKIGLMSLKKDGMGCTRCGSCFRACPMEIREIESEKKLKNLVTQDCTLCLRCIEVCPEDNVLRATFAGLPVFSSSQIGCLKRQNLAPAPKTAESR
jgi:ferredoxin-type protein NapH